MQIIIITLAETPLISVPTIATVEQIDEMIRRRYGVQLADGYPHEWLMLVSPIRKTEQPRGDALPV